MKAQKFFILLLILLGIVGSSFAQAAPDRDGDGVPDSRDNCMSDPGPASNNGCPEREEDDSNQQEDSDGDGMIDSLDRCPTEGGPAQNTGCPEGTNPTTTVTATAPATVPQAVLPTAGACVMASNGTEPVNRREIPSSNGAIVGVIQPNEIFPINFAVNTSEGLWYNTSPFSWVAATVMRLGGDCSRIPTVRGVGQILRDFSGWTAYHCDPEENPDCDGEAATGLFTSIQYPYQLAEVEEDERFLIFIVLFAPGDGGMGLMISNREPGTFPHPDDDGENPFFMDLDLVNYDPVVDPLPPTLPKFSISVDDQPDGGIIVGIPDPENPGDPGYEPVFDIANAEEDVDILGETILTDVPLNDGCDLYEAMTIYHDAEDIGKTYQAYLGSINGYTMLENSTVTAWIEGFGIDYSTHSELDITTTYLEGQEFVTGMSGPGDFFQLSIDELGNYLTIFDVTVSSWTNAQPNKLRLNICLRYP